MGLTSNFVETVKPDADRQRDYPDSGRSGVAGLALRVSPGGKKAWTFRYRTGGGKQRRISLGEYPKVGLAQARIKARAALTARDEGEDPALQRKAAREVQREAETNTVRAVWKRYLADARLGRHRRTRSPRPKRDSSLAYDETYANTYVLPEIGDRPVGSITAKDIDDLTLALLETGKPSRARGSYVVIRQLMSYCRFKGLIEANPIDQTVPPEAAKRRKRILDDEEFSLIWRALECKSRGEPIAELLAEDQSEPAMARGTALALMFLAVTLQRRSEVAGLMLDEIKSVEENDAHWLLPGERTKNYQDHVVPLSALALSLIERALFVSGELAKVAKVAISASGQGDPWRKHWRKLAKSRPLFPSPEDPTQPMTGDALTRSMARLVDALGIQPKARPHDFRRTGSTRMTERLGIQRFTVSKVLNHTLDRSGAAEVTQVYDLYDYLPEKRAALNAWADELVRLKTRP